MGLEERREMEDRGNDDEEKEEKKEGKEDENEEQKEKEKEKERKGKEKKETEEKEEEEEEEEEEGEEVLQQHGEQWFFPPPKSPSPMTFEEYKSIFSPSPSSPSSSSLSWTPKHLSAFLSTIQSLSSGNHPQNIPPSTLLRHTTKAYHNITATSTTTTTTSSPFDPSILYARFSLLLLLNQLLLSSSPLLSLSHSPTPSSLSSLLSPLRSMIFWKTKKEIWDREIARTVFIHEDQDDEYDNPPTIFPVVIGRPKALLAGSGDGKGGSSSSSLSSHSLFHQLYRQLSSLPTHLLRQQYIGKKMQKRCFTVTFKGEGSVDYGGPYRELFIQISEELHSDRVPLFLRCPNYYRSSEHREYWVLNNHISEEDEGEEGRRGGEKEKGKGKKVEKKEDYFHFLGKVMGMAVRGEVAMDLALPPSFWKGVCGGEKGREDLKYIDWGSYLAFKNMEEYMDEELFEECDYSWTNEYSGSMRGGGGGEGEVVELREGGGKVEFEEVGEFVRRNVDYRLGEGGKEEKGLVEGLGEVVPVDVLVLFDQNETRELFCGHSDIDIQTLRSHTVYADLSPSSPHISFFWSVLEEMTFAEKVKFLRFTCAMSRLPFSANDWTMPFTIHAPNGSMRRDPDGSLPISQTCFFSLYLPAYTSKEVMRKGLLTAIECVEMDGDHVVSDNAVWE